MPVSSLGEIICLESKYGDVLDLEVFGGLGDFVIFVNFDVGVCVVGSWSLYMMDRDYL